MPVAPGDTRPDGQRHKETGWADVRRLLPLRYGPEPLGVAAGSARVTGCGDEEEDDDKDEGGSNGSPTAVPSAAGLLVSGALVVGCSRMRLWIPPTWNEPMW